MTVCTKRDGFLWQCNPASMPFDLGRLKVLLRKFQPPLVAQRNIDLELCEFRAIETFVLLEHGRANFELLNIWVSLDCGMTLGRKQSVKRAYVIGRASLNHCLHFANGIFLEASSLDILVISGSS